MTPPPRSHLARGLGPLGLGGSLLLHAIVLAAVLRAPLPQDSVTPSAPRLTVGLMVPTPPEAPRTEPPLEPEREPEPMQAAPETAAPPPDSMPQPVALPPPAAAKPRPPKPAPIPRPVKPALPADVAAAPPAPAVPAPSSETEAAVPAPQEPHAPVRLSAPKFRNRTAPTYPAQALRDEMEGTVRLKLLIGAEGTVQDASLLRSSGHRLLDQAALAAARTWELEPAQQNGTPVPAWAEVDVPFRLTD